MDEDTIKDITAKIFSIIDQHEEANNNPLKDAEIIDHVVGAIMATYITNKVEPPLREYVCAKMIFSLAGGLSSLLETLNDTNISNHPIDSYESS